jgi:hypothetical protein
MSNHTPQPSARAQRVLKQLKQLREFIQIQKARKHNKLPMRHREIIVIDRIA